jgi:hypothetical protein
MELHGRERREVSGQLDTSVPTRTGNSLLEEVLILTSKGKPNPFPPRVAQILSTPQHPQVQGPLHIRESCFSSSA